PESAMGPMNRWRSRAGRKAPINRTHSKRFAPAKSVDDARASSAPLSQGSDSMARLASGHVNLVRTRRHAPTLRRSCALTLLVLLLTGMFPARAQTSKEYQIKAAFLFNFAQFVEWPSAAF